MIKRKGKYEYYQESITINGKRKFFYGKTKAEVLKKMRAFEEERNAPVPFHKVADQWQDEHWPQIVPSTARGYTASLKRAIQTFGNTPIADITHHDITLMLRGLAAQKYGKKVVTTQKNVLHMIFEKAVIDGIIESNPCIYAKLPQNLPSQRRELPSDRDIEIVKQTDWLFPYFLLYTGCRRGEALAVTYEDIDFEKNVIHINKAVGYDDDVPYIKEPKTGAGKRDIILLEPLKARLLPIGSGLVFPNHQGRLFTNSQMLRAWKRWQEKEGTSITAHQLRHAFATMLFEADIDVKDAQSLLGHSNISVTMDIYTHIRQSRMDENAEKLNTFLRKGL